MFGTNPNGKDFSMSESSEIVPVELPDLASVDEMLANIPPFDPSTLPAIRDPKESEQDAELAFDMLPPLQQQVIDMLLQGTTITVISDRLNLDRGTIYRWRKFDSFFRDAMEKKQQQIREEAGDNIKNLICRSAQVVQMAVNSHDLRAALFVLKSAGVFKALQIDVASNDKNKPTS